MAVADFEGFLDDCVYFICGTGEGLGWQACKQLDLGRLTFGRPAKRRSVSRMGR